tara:strand:- start:80 stop:409 length:330 start_codon:yes stop_codon:yes gene_type:complete
MRDKIAEIVTESHKGVSLGFPNDLWAADAIMAALPSMVKPLVWGYAEGADHRYSGDYALILFKNGYLVDYKDCAIVCDLSEEQAKAAANAHHRAAIIAAFGVNDMEPSK